MKKTTIRVTMRNNSDARSFHVLDSVRHEHRHNGGKLVIVTVDGDSYLEEARGLLDASHAVASYEES